MVKLEAPEERILTYLCKKTITEENEIVTPVLEECLHHTRLKISHQKTGSPKPDFLISFSLPVFLCILLIYFIHIFVPIYFDLTFSAYSIAPKSVTII